MAATSSGSLAPRALRVVEFAKARAMEISVMANELRRRNASKRTFQMLPRHLRRRAMSHSARRMPTRIRNKAARELEQDARAGRFKKKKGEAQAQQQGGEEEDDGAPGTSRKKKLSRRTIRRRLGTTAAAHLRRQLKHTWLETHIWHAKRLHMANLWGYRLAFRRADVQMRFAYRTTAHECTLHDASYHTAFEVSGASREAVVAFLAPLLDPAGTALAAPHMARGAREGDLFLYAPGAFPYGALGPARFLWRPPAPGGGPALLWLWVHAAAHADAFAALRARALAPGATGDFRSLRGELVRLELRGPRAHRVLARVLRPPTPGPRGGLLGRLRGLRTPASLPAGAVLGMEVHDPRLALPCTSSARSGRPPTPVRPPPAALPREVNLAMRAEAPEVAEADLVAVPEGAQACPGLWDAAERAAAKARREPEAAINARRGEARPRPSSAWEGASRPWVMVVQRPGEGQRGFSAGWDVVAPAGWGAPFWRALVYAGARPLGLKERRWVATEARRPEFPFDEPDTPGAARQAAEDAEAALGRHVRRPPAKRVAYAKLGVAAPFGPDWHGLLALPRPPPARRRPAPAAWRPRRRARARPERRRRKPARARLLHRKHRQGLRGQRRGDGRRGREEAEAGDGKAGGGEGAEEGPGGGRGAGPRAPPPPPPPAGPGLPTRLPFFVLRGIQRLRAFLPPTTPSPSASATPPPAPSAPARPQAPRRRAPGLAEPALPPPEPAAAAATAPPAPSLPDVKAEDLPRALILVAVEALGKGRVEPSSVLLAPTEEDRRAWAAAPSEFAPEEWAPGPGRAHIGAVSSGDVAFGAGRGAGLAYVAAPALLRLRAGERPGGPVPDGFALLRPLRSRTLRPVRLSVLL
eukprot:tig00000403_g335.t1